MDMSASEQNKIIKNSMRAMDDFLINNELYSKGHTLTELSSAPDTQYIADATLFDRMATYKNAQIAEILNNAGVKYVNAEIQPGTNYTKLTKLADDIAKFGSEYQKMVAQDVVKMANNKLYTLAEAKKSSPAKNIVSVIAKVSSKYKLSKVFGIDALLNKLVFEGTSGGVGVDAKYIIHNTLADGIINK
jgi:replicative DNA helicase